MKKLLCFSSFLLVSMLCILPTDASEIKDYDNLLTQTAQLELEDIMESIAEETGVELSILMPEDFGEFSNATEYTQDYMSSTYEEDSDVIVLTVCLNEGTWLMSTDGLGDTAIGEYGYDFVYENVIPNISVGEYSTAFDDYVSYCKEFIDAAIAGNPYTVDNPYDLEGVAFEGFVVGQDIIDLSDLISSDVEQQMQEIIDSVRELYDFNISVITVEDYGNYSTTRTYTDAAYYHLYGEEDGVILMLRLNQRDWYISTEGYGDTAINDYCLDVIEEKVIPCFSSSDYDKGFYNFVDYCSQFLEEAKTNTPYTYNNQFKTLTDYLKVGGMVLLGSAVIGIAYVVMLTGKMKNIRPVDSAGNYLSRDSFKLLNSSDNFLYSHVSKVPKPKNNGGGGGGRGSGGGSSGGRGGKF